MPPQREQTFHPSLAFASVVPPLPLVFLELFSLLSVLASATISAAAELMAVVGCLLLLQWYGIPFHNSIIPDLLFGSPHFLPPA